MQAEDDELWRVTAEQAENVRRSMCEDLELQLLALQREHRLLLEKHTLLKMECEDRQSALQRIAALTDIIDKSTALDQVIVRIRSTIDRIEGVN